MASPPRGRVSETARRGATTGWVLDSPAWPLWAAWVRDPYPGFWGAGEDLGLGRGTVNLLQKVQLMTITSVTKRREEEAWLMVTELL